MNTEQGDGFMAVADARIFLKQAVADRHLRDQLNEAPSAATITRLLKARNLCFTRTELEEAYRGLLAHSQTAEEATLVREIKTWWDFLSTAVDR